MSSKPKTQPDSRLIREYDSEPLTKGQKSQLHMLGYKTEDIIEFTVPEALAIIQTRSAKPGSKAFIKAETARLAAAGIAPPAGIADESDEAIDARNASRPQASGVQVTRDEFTNQCLQSSTENFVMDEYKGRVVSGSDPLNAMLLEMEERYCVYKDGFDKNGSPIKVRVPTRRFRWSHKDDPAEVGPAPEPVYDSRTKQLVTNGELFMVWMPADVWKEGRQEPQLARSRAMTGAVEGNKDDLMRTRDEMGPATEGRLEMGRSEANYGP